MRKLPLHLFASSDGDLYDTRVPNWHMLPPLRKSYCYTHAKIESVAQFKATLRAGGHTFPGCYPLFLITADGESLSFNGARKRLRDIIEAIRQDDTRSGFRVAACAVNYEDAELLCCETGQPIESAYGEAAA